MVSIAQSWFNEGKAEGKVEGKAEAKNKIVINLLKQNIDIKTISLVTDYNIKQIEELKNKTT